MNLTAYTMKKPTTGKTSVAQCYHFLYQTLQSLPWQLILVSKTENQNKQTNKKHYIKHFFVYRLIIAKKYVAIIDYRMFCLKVRGAEVLNDLPKEIKI